MVKMYPILSLVVSVFSLLSFAAEENPTQVVVTATRLNTSEENVASSFTVVTGEEIRRKQKTTVSEVLQEVPGLTVSNSGGAGKITSVFIRGMKAEHTLVLLDGIQMNDPLDAGRAFDFGNLCADNIDRIEVIRGAQSVMYGSDAIGGVVHIITKKGSGPPHGAVQAEYGEYRTQRAQAEVNSGDEKFNYSLSASIFATKGFSAADESQGNSEKDGARLGTVSSRFGGAPIKKLDVDVVTRFSDGKFDIDANGGPGGDDPNYKASNTQFYSKVETTSHHFGVWEPILGVSYSTSRKTTDNDPDTVRPALAHTVFDSARRKLHLQNNFLLNAFNTVTLGGETQREEGASVTDSGSGPTSRDDGASLTGAFLQHQFESDSLFSSLGARWDSHERFGSQTTYRIASGYKIQATRTTLKATLGTGFKAPSLFQLFSSYGDPSLHPEQSTSYDFGIEQKFNEPKIKIGITYFGNQLTDLISYDFATQKYKNISKLKTQGIEFTVTSEMLAWLSVALNYTYTDVIEEDTGLRALRRPLHQASSSLIYKPWERWQTVFLVQYVGNRPDIDAVTFGRIEMPGYTLFGLTSAYFFTKDLKIFARLDNLLNTKYQAVNGYGTAGRSLFIGLRKEL